MQKQQETVPLTSCSANEQAAHTWTHILGLLVLAVLFGVLSGCTNQQIVPLNVAAEHPERFVCKRADGSMDAEIKRPTIPEELSIDLSGSVADSTASVAAFMKRLRERESIIAKYIVAIEAVNFQCWDNMSWQRDVYSYVE